jgi:hypothetical protein
MGSAPSSDNKKLSTVASTKSSSTKSFDPTSTSNVSATNNNTKLHRGIKSQRTSKERIAAAREAVADSRDTGEFHNICMSVFENADRDNDGNLSRAEFFSGLHFVVVLYYRSFNNLLIPLRYEIFLLKLQMPTNLDNEK